MTQLPILFARVLTLPPDADGSFSDDAVEWRDVDVVLSPRQALWMGLSAPFAASCPGCVLFGCCALHGGDECA